MRVFIRWIFFKNEDLSKLIFNDTNNENWPNANTYSDLMKKWFDEVDNQQKEINQLEIKNNKTRQLMTDVQIWFINECNLLKKPAKRVWLEKTKELKRLEHELKVHQYNLDHPKTELEEYEKQCLLNKIRVGERKKGSCKDDLAKAEEAYENEKRELCKRLAYNKEDIPEPFLRNPEERIDPITRQLVISHEDYSKWWRIGYDIHPESEPLAELNKRIDEWYNHNEGKGPEYNPYEIWVTEKTENSITFLWKPVERELESLDEKGEKVMIKGQYLALCKNYLFNYYGEWYEVVDYYQTNYTSVVIIARKSIFYNNYWHLLKSQGNVIVHHAPPEIASQEICSCPSYEVYTSKDNFILDYELNFNFYRIGEHEAREGVIIDEEGRIKAVASPVPAWVSNVYQEKKVIEEGKKNAVYLLLNKKVKTQENSNYIEPWFFEFFRCPSEENIGQLSEIKDIYFKRTGEFDMNEKRTKLTDETKEKHLQKKGLLKNEMHHFLKTHIEATLYWRGTPIWKGNYFDLHKANEMMLVESTSPSGNCITIQGGGRILCRINELVTVKTVEDPKKKGVLKAIVHTVITVATVAAGAAVIAGTGGTATPAVVAGIAKVGVGMLGGYAHIGANYLMASPQVSETSQSMTINEFRHKYLMSGARPISLLLAYNQELANQYLNKRELKGPMLYSYKNFLHLGELLIKQPSHPNYFLKASIISWNMVHNAEWFREKIESGVYIYDGNHRDFYQRKLSGEKNATNQGAIAYQNWNEFTIRGGGSSSNTINVSRRKGSNYHQRAHYLIEYEDGSKEHWLGLLPGFKNEELTDGHSHGAFILEFSKPVKYFYDVYTCIGCGARGQFLDLHSGYDGGSDSWDTLYKILPVEPWFSTVPTSGLSWNGRCMGGGNDVWEGKKIDCGRTFTKAYGFVPNGETIMWKLETIMPDEIIKNRGGIPAGIPPSKPLPTDPNQAGIPPATPFNPNQFPQSGNLTPNPTGSGEQEFAVPDIDNDYDPDFDQSLDPDFGIDPDTGTDPDKPTEPDVPPDTPPDDPYPDDPD